MYMGSVADPYHFDTYQDPGPEKILYESRFGPNFYTDPDPGKKGFSTRENLQKLIKRTFK